MKAANKFLPLYVYVTLLGLALFSFLGLDYIAWKKGEESVIFPAFYHEKKPLVKGENLIHTVEQAVREADIHEQNISKYTDKYGICHIMVNLDREKYGFLEKILEKNFGKVKASIQKKQEKKEQGIEYVLWEVSQREEIPLSLLFSIEPEKELKEFARPPVIKKTAALIIDDMGYSLESIKDICSMKREITVAILPFSPHARETAEIARQNGLEVILHLPLEAVNNAYENKHTLGLINMEMNPEEVLTILNNNLSQVPFISGVNTHMGSKVTKDKKLMGIILENIREKQLYFIDSRTTSQSIAYDMAQKLNIPSACRHIFLDSKTDPEYIKDQFVKFLKRAHKNGTAVGICHPFPETLQVLKENIHLADEFNVSLVPASRVVR